MKRLLQLACVALLLALVACQSSSETTAANEKAKEETLEQTPQRPSPPAPPLLEDFEGKPRLSLFPRVGDFQPEPDETERIGFWRTFIDHLVRTSGLREFAEQQTRVFGIRSIKSMDSVAFFSPLAVEPETTYRVTFDMKAALPEGVSAGAGILEFDEFLWVGEQFTESLTKKHHLRTREGVRRKGEIDWQQQTFSFTTTPRTRMVHLVLFVDGEAGRQPVLFDNVSIESVIPNQEREN